MAFTFGQGLKRARALAYDPRQASALPESCVAPIRLI
jgi:hypothetical protein